MIETPFGRVSLLVDVDICYPQVSARAAELGANLLISSMYVQPQDLDAICADRVGIGAAVSNGIPVAAVMTNGAVVALPDGSCPLPFTDALPADLSLSLPEPGARGYELGRGRALLSGHRGLLGGLVNG